MDNSNAYAHTHAYAYLEGTYFFFLLPLPNNRAQKPILGAGNRNVTVRAVFE